MRFTAVFHGSARRASWGGSGDAAGVGRFARALPTTSSDIICREACLITTRPRGTPPRLAMRLNYPPHGGRQMDREALWAPHAGSLFRPDTRYTAFPCLTTMGMAVFFPGHATLSAAVSAPSFRHYRRLGTISSLVISKLALHVLVRVRVHVLVHVHAPSPCPRYVQHLLWYEKPVLGAI